MWRFVTDQGTFFISWARDGRYQIVFGNQKVGSYRSPAEAADSLANGSAVVPGVKTTALDIPTDIGEWDFVPRRRRIQSDSSDHE